MQIVSNNIKLNIPKKLVERFGYIECAGDLIDGCKYILGFNDGWAYGDDPNIPVRSKQEAIQCLRDANTLD